MQRVARAWYKGWISPLRTSPDEQRREYIFNVLIAFFTFAALATSLSSGITHFLGANAHNTDSVPVTLGFLIVSSGLWWLSRRGHYKFGAYVLIGLLLVASLQLTLAWSIELPMAELMTVLVIIVAGLVISSRAVIVTTIIVSVWTIILGYMQAEKLLSVDTTWLTKRLELSDGVGLVVVYVIVGAVAWLANNEIDALLKRAWRSEKELAKERDQLEVTVAKRTRELEQSQLERTLELQHFAEFGRVSAGLIHDVSTPLTAASLNLEQLGDEKSSDLVDEALGSLRHIEDYIESARKQLQDKSEPSPFLARRAIAEVVGLIKHQARDAGVEILISSGHETMVYGDIVAFHRVMANLIINAIESYGGSHKRKRVVDITIGPSGNQLTVIIHDNGAGIASDDLPHIFENFYSTKKHPGRGLGLGLASAKQVIEKEFKGHIDATSHAGQGTTFTIGIPIYEKKHPKKYSKRH